MQVLLHVYVYACRLIKLSKSFVFGSLHVDPTLLNITFNFASPFAENAQLL
jgi:hypothetical protein